MFQLFVIGGGPAGLSAAIYAARAGLHTAVWEPEFSGGQMVNTAEIVNYPGFSQISGAELAMSMESHAKALGVTFLPHRVTGLSLEPDDLRVVADSESMPAQAVILAMGAARRPLGCPGEASFTGRGVSYCATCDGGFFKNKRAVVVGGGNTALEDALYLANICSEVFLIHRRDRFRGHAALEKAVRAHPRITLLLDSVVTEITGTRQVEAALVQNVKTGDTQSLSTDAVFIAVGTLPSTQLLQGTKLLDDNGFVVAGEDTLTVIPGVFAAGDLRRKPLYQIVTACADGAVAATAAAHFLLGKD